MIFSIDEQGDLNLSEENESMCNVIQGDVVISNFNTSKTIILTYFKHNNNLKNKFYKNKRNTLTDSQIKEFFDDEIAEAFKMKMHLVRNIKYEFVNDKSSFHILFYFYSEKLKRIILDYDVNI